MMEHNFIPKSRKYLDNFINAKVSIYIDAHKEYHPLKGYGYYKNSTEILDCLSSIIGNFQDRFASTSIPESFTSVNELIKAADTFYTWLKKSSDKIFDEAFNAYAEDEVPMPIIEINQIRNDTINAFKEFVRLATLEVIELQIQIKAKDAEGIDVRKFKPKHIWDSIKNWTWYSHLLVWGLICTLASIIAFFYVTFNHSDNNEADKKWYNLYLSTNENLIKVNEELQTKNKIIDSLENKNETIVHDTIYKDKSDLKTKEIEEKIDAKSYSISVKDIKEGAAFNDKKLGISITLINISSDFTANAVHDIPEIFGTISTQKIKVSAGKFWKFKKNKKNYKLVISKINYTFGTYDIDLFELSD